MASSWGMFAFKKIKRLSMKSSISVSASQQDLADHQVVKDAVIIDDVGNINGFELTPYFLMWSKTLKLASLFEPPHSRGHQTTNTVFM